MTEQTITCPKCGLQQPQALECRRCGVIFARLAGRQPAKTAAPAPAKLPQKKQGAFFRNIRIAVLLLLLVGLGLNILLTRWRIAEWNRSLWVVIHPICADTNPATQEYVDSLTAEDFAPLANFFSEEAGRYGLKTQEPFTFVLAPRLDSMPPPIPDRQDRLAMILWSLKLRFWAGRINAASAPVQDIKLFVLYHDKSRTLVDHSYVMQKGYIGIINAYGAKKLNDKNAVVMAHELLHLAGATDKYNPETELPLYPDGYADPDASPLYPQSSAEIMAGSIPVSETQSAMPESLDNTVIGPATAREINWLPAK